MLSIRHTKSKKSIDDDKTLSNLVRYKSLPGPSIFGTFSAMMNNNKRRTSKVVPKGGKTKRRRQKKRKTHKKK